VLNLFQHDTIKPSQPVKFNKNKAQQKSTEDTLAIITVPLVGFGAAALCKYLTDTLAGTLAFNEFIYDTGYMRVLA
jgi:hypothetical protein